MIALSRKRARAAFRARGHYYEVNVEDTRFERAARTFRAKRGGMELERAWALLTALKREGKAIVRKKRRAKGRPE